ncbi:DUF3854 domain-containing protein [Anaeromyxobacter dehalogenans]|uniref:DUF3854 domain-containing protein n=1 Tax=Anaeromyxobacter dehalogenans TaxID=161493 RepID=UPI00059B622B|nr:DUF3854 domain-containing protein [Anaeromyxobacter dehalogenans]
MSHFIANNEVSPSPTSTPDSTSNDAAARPKTLSERHCQHLVDSGLTAETIARRGFYSCSDAEGRKILNWSERVRGNASGLVIPYPNVPGYAKIRPDSPRLRSGEWPAPANEPHHDYRVGDARWEPEPEVRKYEAPIGSMPHAYIPVDACASFSDAEVRLYVTEGEKKTEVLCQQGQPCISIPGVSNAHDVDHRREAQDWGGARSGSSRRNSASTCFPTARSVSCSTRPTWRRT